MGNPDWESSFTNILNRTKQNLSRINNRYAPPGGDNLTSSYPPPGNENRMNNTASSQNIFGAKSGGQNKVDASGNIINNSAGGGGGNTSEDALFHLMDRINRIEQERRSEQPILHKYVMLEKTVDNLQKQVDVSQSDNKELQRTVNQLSGKLALANGVIETLQSDNDAKRGVISKMDSWIRQGEEWREESENQLSALQKQFKALQRVLSEQKETMSDHVTRYDLEHLKDRVSVMVQQSVAASLSSWHDKFEMSIRNVERQVALVRVGMTDKNDGGASSGLLQSPEEIAAALQTTLPSEMLLKNTVSSEVLKLESGVESRLEGRINAYVQQELNVMRTNMQRELRDKISVLCTESGLYVSTTDLELDTADPYRCVDSSSGGGLPPAPPSNQEHVPDSGNYSDYNGSEAGASQQQQQQQSAYVSKAYRNRIIEARRDAERSAADINAQIQALSTQIHDLQRQLQVDRKSATASASDMQRKVDEVIGISTHSVSAVETRSSKLEEIVRDAENAMRSKVAETKEEVSEFYVMSCYVCE